MQTEQGNKKRNRTIEHRKPMVTINRGQGLVYYNRAAFRLIGEHSVECIVGYGINQDGQVCIFPVTVPRGVKVIDYARITDYGFRERRSSPRSHGGKGISKIVPGGGGKFILKWDPIYEYAVLDTKINFEKEQKYGKKRSSTGTGPLAGGERSPQEVPIPVGQPEGFR